MRRVIAHDHRDKCPDRKIRYRDEASAVEHLRVIAQLTDDDHTIPVRAYYHAACNGYHLTSNPNEGGFTDGAPDEVKARKQRGRRQVRRQRQTRDIEDLGLATGSYLPRLSRRVIDD